MTVQEIAPQIRAAIPDPLEKPGIRQAPDGMALDPMAVHNTGRLTTEIKRLLQGLLETDEFFVQLTGWNSAEPRSSYTSPVLQFGPPNLRTLNLESSVVAFNLGQKITVEYTVNRVGETSVTSDELELNVLDLPAGALEKGRILEAQDDGNGAELDLTTNTEDRTLHIDNYPLIAIGQWCWVVLKGKKADGSDYDKALFKGQVDQDWITLGHLQVPVLYSELKELAPESDLKITYQVAFDQVDDETKANVSMVRSYTVKAAAVEVKPAITAVTDSKDTPIADNGTTTDTTVKLSGTVAAGEKVEIYDGATSLGEATTTGITWTYEAKNLTPKAYAFKAKGKYGSLPESNIWNVTVQALEVKPAITAVTDSKDVPIADNGSTTDTTVKLSGTVAAGEKVEIYDGATPLGEAVTTGTVWTYEAKNLTSKAYAFKAKGKYGSLPESGTWTVTVTPPVETEKPIIASVKDLSGNDVLNESIIVQKTLNLTIKAGTDEELEIFVNGASKDKKRADAQGNLVFQLKDLDLEEQDIKVEGVESKLASDIFTVIVKPDASDGTLKISDTKDPLRNVILPGGATTARGVTIVGTAERGKTVTVSDVFSALDTVVTDRNGYWRLTLSGLNVHYYHLKLSADGADSPMLWPLTVFTVGTPIIERVTDLAGTTLIPPYGETSGQEFTLYGAGPANETLTLHELLSDVKTSVSVGAEGKWQFTQRATIEPREYHYVVSAPGEGSPKSNLYRVRKVTPTK